VFKSKSEVFMIPETSAVERITIYRAERFPDVWVPFCTVAEGDPYEDATLFWKDDRWWLITSFGPKSEQLRIFHSQDLAGPWIAHPNEMSLNGIGRPAGRVVRSGDVWIRFVQDVRRVYGESVYANRIDVLDSDSFVESPIDDDPLLGPTGSGWNGYRMHHIDSHQTGPEEWVACVDGSGLGRIMSRVVPTLGLDVKTYN
jgi:hypothetical protein